MKRYVLTLLALVCWADPVPANESLPSWLADGPYLEQSSASFEVPIEVHATKIYVAVELGGKSRRFVLDTGSPSMIDTALVEALDLAVVDTNKGTDAHGNIIETQIVQADIQIADVAIKKLPMMAANFTASIATKAFIGDGVLGSDLLPLGAWQIDLESSVLRFNTSLKHLPHIKDAQRQKLYQFGYPFMPIFDVQFAKKARSKAMLDTGSPTFFAISSPDLAGTKKASGISRMVTGDGSPGSSLGGQAPSTELIQVELDQLAIGDLVLGKVVAMGRASPPSLIGARILESFIVTLDSRSKAAYFKRYADEPFARPSFGFSLAFDGEISVGAVWDESPAKAVGLEAGMEITSINGQAVEFTQAGLVRALDAMAGQEIELTWNGGSAKLEKELAFPVD